MITYVPDIYGFLTGAPRETWFYLGLAVLVFLALRVAR